MHTIFFTYKQLFSLFMRRYEEEELYFVIAEKRLFNNVYVLDAITTITFHKLKTGHTISDFQEAAKRKVFCIFLHRVEFLCYPLYIQMSKK